MLNVILPTNKKIGVPYTTFGLPQKRVVCKINAYWRQCFNELLTYCIARWHLWFAANAFNRITHNTKYYKLYATQRSINYITGSTYHSSNIIWIQSNFVCETKYVRSSAILPITHRTISFNFKMWAIRLSDSFTNSEIEFAGDWAFWIFTYYKVIVDANTSSSIEIPRFPYKWWISYAHDPSSIRRQYALHTVSPAYFTRRGEFWSNAKYFDCGENDFQCFTRGVWVGYTKVQSAFPFWC